MPTYTYRCQKCNSEKDVFHSMSATPRVACDDCNSKRMVRLLGTGAGLIFKGSGFYETDYKAKKGEKPASEKKADTAKESKPSGDTSTKKTETKAAATSN